MFKRLRKLWTLSKKDPKALELLETMTPEQIALVPDEPVEGDGKAVFFGEGTQEEFIDQQREDKGMKPWYDRLKNLVNDPT